MPTEAEVAWAAGFFEGEGCIRHHDGWEMNVAQNDPEIPLRFQLIVGCGKVDVQKMRQKSFGKRPLYYWRLYRVREIQRLMALFGPWLSTRRRAQYAKATANYELGRRRPVTHCKRGHEFTAENTYVWAQHRQCRTCRVTIIEPRKRLARLGQVLPLLQEVATS